MVTNRIFTDQMGREVSIPFPPKRIISLVPSQTELLYDLGLTNEVVGQTIFCIHPAEMHEQKQRIGGTKNVNLATVKALSPDLIIGNKEENSKENIEELAQLYPVWMSDIENLSDSLAMILAIGELTQKQHEATIIAQQIEAGFDTIRQTAPLKVAYLIWRKPWMASGGNTFITDMLSKMGLHNVFANAISRYPEITNEQLASSDADVIFLSSEPYPFKQKHIEELQQICPKAKIILVDGELFSWYGSRLLHSPNYFNSLLQTLSI